MRSDTPLDYAAFHLSPTRSRCELFVSSGGNTERIASGLVKPFVTHLKVAEEQVVSSALRSIRLQVEGREYVETWFTKGTLERFVRFVSTPEVLELVSTYDAEMSQLDAARMMYSQGSSDKLSNALGGERLSSATGGDATKRELQRAIDVRLATVKQDLATACARAEAAGFNHETVADLQSFAERFGATRLNQACSKYVSLHNRHPELFNNPSCKSDVRDQPIQSSYASNTSLDDDRPTTTSQPPKSLSSSATFPSRRGITPISQESSVHADTSSVVNEKQKEEGGVTDDPLAQPATQTSSRRLSVQDRINLFENKQKEGGPPTGGGAKLVATKPELRRFSSDVSHSHSAAPPAVLRRWSGATDTSIDLSGDNKEDQKDIPGYVITEVQEDQTHSATQLTVSSSVKSEESVGSNQLTSNLEKTHSLTSLTKSDDDSLTGSQVNDFDGGQEEQVGKSDQVKFGFSTVASSEQDTRLVKDTNPRMMTLRAPPKKASLSSGSKIREAFAASQQRRLEVGLLRSQPRLNSVEVQKEDSISTEEQYSRSGPQKSKFQKQVQNDDGSGYVHGYSNTPPSGKFFQGGSGSRQLKGNQELNDELKVKANELEKLFAEHKLRVPGDQPNPTHQSKASDVESDQTTRLAYRKQVADPIL
ncbi:hypothetical protein Tco_0145873 [Tanacetum coccineum]